MYRNRTLKQKIFLFLKGLLMGAANKVPGVSGGTVSFVFGFYEELIESFKRINIKAFKLLLSGRFTSFYVYTNAQFVMLIMGGSIFSYFSVSLVLDFFLKHYELHVWSLFFGMILGSIIYIYKRFGVWKKDTILSLIIGVLLGLGISFLPQARENDNLWFVFLCGIIGVSGMTLPGLSGSFILILMGNYVLLLVDSVNVLFSVIVSLVTGDFDAISDPENVRYLKIIAVFTAGSAFGLVFISHLLSYVLKKFHQIVTAIIIGFIAGSLGIVWPWKTKVFAQENGVFLTGKNGNKMLENYDRYLPSLQDSETWFAILSILVGLAIVLGLDYYEKLKKERIFGLLGKNISYSFSKSYFSEKFTNLKIKNSIYRNFDISKIEDFKTILKQNKKLKGLNVTIPYKQQIIPFLDSLDPTALEIGAVNTIRFTNSNTLKGFNTDAVGFENSLRPLLKKHHQKALILGTGGASKAITFVLKKLQIDFKLVSRKAEGTNIITYKDLDQELIEKYHLIINCTPVGTSPNLEECPDIPYQFLSDKHLLYDLIYNPAVTTFLSKGREQGTIIKNGLEMLELQAEESWRIWNA